MKDGEGRGHQRGCWGCARTGAGGGDCGAEDVGVADVGAKHTPGGFGAGAETNLTAPGSSGEVMDD